MSYEEAEAARLRIMYRARKIIDENERIIRDTLYWNDYVRAVKFPDYPPIDVEPCRMTISKARIVLRKAIDGTPIPDSLMSELIEAAAGELM